MHRSRREDEIEKHLDMLSLYPLVDLPSLGTVGDTLSGGSMLYSWWFHDFVSHSYLALLVGTTVGESQGITAANMVAVGIMARV
jgi:hypothetical protein